MENYTLVEHLNSNNLKSPSQDSLEFDNFNSFNPDFSIILGDFNAKSKNWWHCDTQTSEGSRIDSLITYGFQQLISEPTRILKDSSSCIDLIFTDQPNLITDVAHILLYIQIVIIT